MENIMNETIDLLASLIQDYKNLDESPANQPDEQDANQMLGIIKELISIKEKEISAYDMLFCNAAHSFGDNEIVLIDLTRSQYKKELKSLEKLKSALKLIAC